MFILCVKPVSSQADRALAAIQNNLFAQTASPAFLALPPHAVVDLSDSWPSVHLLDSVPRIGAVAEDGGGDPDAVHSSTGQIVANGRKLYYLPQPQNQLIEVWERVAGEFQAKPGAGPVLSAQQFGAARPALYLGETESDTTLDHVRLDEPLLASVGAIRSYAIAVIRIETRAGGKWWEQMRWTIIYERELGHRKRGSERE
ncbi:MAG TPA: hypothetical protein VMW73_16870 [Spirochaetia bacterium]|nr:hypothetical protein [Spirochaetia bacterium]